ncbi:MAG: hypothetical protein LAO77_25100 [Acidobacteriia bacterium]|nr:hypothetical protein [Terriglobia bacterium]
MPSRFTALRPFVLLFFLIPALLLCAFAGVLCLRHGEVPAGLVNSGVVGGLARRLGVEYHVRSLRVGCLHADCGAGLDASGVHVLLPAFDGLQIDVAGLHVCAAHPLSIQSVRAHVDGGAGLQIGAVDVSAKGTDARDVRFTTTTNSTVAVRQVSMAPPVLSKQTGELTVASIDAAGMDVRLSPAPAAEVCEQTHAALVSSGRLAAATSASIDRLSRAVGRLHRNLIYVALLLPAALFLLKIWVTAWTGQWRRRFVLGAACVLIPLALYALAGALPLARLAVLAFAVSALAGAIMYYVIYRHAPRRYERWEPCAVDVACALIVLPLGAVSFTSMAPRALSSVTIGRVGVADVTLSGSNDSCGQERRFSAAMKSARIDNVAVGLPASARDDTVLSIATVRIPNLSAGVRDGSGATVDAVRIPDAQASADQIQVTLDWKTERIRQIDARLRLRGSAESAALVDELRKVRVLAPIVSGLGATDFDVDVRAAGASTAAAGDLDRFDDVQSTIAVRARVTIDPRQCALTYATAMRVLTPQAKLVASGDGDLSHVEVRSIRSLPGSAVDVGSGSGTLSFGDRPAAHVTLVRLGIARGAARVRMASADASASTAPQCSPVNQSIVVAIAGADVDTGRGARARIARTDARVTRQDASSRQAVSLRTRLDDVHFTVRPSADGPAEIDGSLPAVQLTGRGFSTSELIPQHLDGALDVSIATAADGQIHNTTPLRFRADVWDGSIVVPVQTQVLSQSIVAGLPSDLAFSIAADGRLPSTPSAGDGRIDARVRVPRVPFNSGPVQAELRDLAVSFITGAAGRVSYDSGWNTLTPPPAPKAFCLEDISRFDLATEGQIARWSPPDAIADLQPRLQPCLDGPVVSTERRFRVQGVWPGIKLEGPSGAGIEVLRLARPRPACRPRSSGRILYRWRT